MTYIKETQAINIYTFVDGKTTVYIQHPNIREMVEAPQLVNLPEILEAMFLAETNPALQDALERVKMLYALSVEKKQDEVMWHPV